MSDAFEVYVDARGLLLPIDLTDLPFSPLRLFVVTGPADGATRGGHVAPCRELVVLLTGTAEIRYDDEATLLEHPGERVLLEPGGRVDYDLAPHGSSILVLADAAYDPERT